MASSSIVIKVKFGETLRRFNASIDDKKLALDMVALKEKIRSLFSFGSDVEFTMTYVDEDGDAVTLADDDDLNDVVRQSLTPLRITVKLNNNNFNGPSRNSTSPESSQSQHPFQSLNSGVSEILKSVPVPLLEALTKLPLDLASKASSSSSDPVVVELMEKLKAVYLNQILSSMTSPRAHPTTGGPSNMNSESSSVENSKVNPEAGGLNSKKKEKQVQKVTDGVDKKKDSSSEKKDDISDGSFNEPLKRNSFIEHVNQWAEGVFNANSKYSFSGMPSTTESDSQGHHRHFCSPHWKRSNCDNNDTSNVFHRGIICDGCGVHPITGPRFKSKVKIDYDLCNLCFAEMGNATDYIRMDHPINPFRHRPISLKGFHDSSLHVPPPVTLPQSKLDSRFVLDVNVLDGTIMAPLTAFTKIWRMRNNGSINWPYGSQLQWVAGDCLSSSLYVDVKVPVDGLPVDKEVDISVDFTAPGLPGRYVSYWMMASPSGQKFGQRVWVIIQVDASMKNLGETSINLNHPPVMRESNAVNQDHLVDNILSGDGIITDPEKQSSCLPPKDQEMKFPVNDSLNIDNDGVSSTVGTALDSLPVGPTFTSGLDSEPISYPTVDFSVVPPVMCNDAASPPKVVVQPPSVSGGQVASDDQEQAPVKDLEAMGFKNLDLNKELLRVNNYDLEKSIDDLCGVLEWDPMLDELREMGFEDDEVNKRLLKKNNGSIKGVVMDLIKEEKA